MSVWRDETDFIKDIESISEFYISGHHNESNKKFVFKSKKKDNGLLKSTPWYESDSEDEACYGFGRGRISDNYVTEPGKDVDHLDVMRGIQMEVRRVVGNRYNNEALESYYNVMDDNEDTVCPSPSIAPKEVSISYAKEQHRKTSPEEQGKKFSVADSIESSTTKLSARDQNPSTSESSTLCSSSSASSSPKRENMYSNKGPSNRRRYPNRPNRGNFASGSRSSSWAPFSSPKTEVDVSSNVEFPPLS